MKYSGFRNLENSISKIIKPISKKKKDNFALLSNLNKNWPKIVGEKYCAFCLPKKVTINKNNQATLYISAHNSAIAFALQGQTSQIIEKIASYFGYKMIHALRISQELREIKLPTKQEEVKITQRDEKFIQKNTKDIKNQELRNILERLGKSILGEKTN